MKRGCRVCLTVWTLVCLLSLSLPALPWEGRVVQIHDGDTLVVQRKDGALVRIRLYGIDCPEFPGAAWGAQAYCKKAREFVIELLRRGTVAVIDMGFDKYTRTVAGVVSLPDGRVVQEELLRAGLAWVYPKYCDDCRQWKEIEEAARNARRGLWRDKAPIPPWEWRHKNDKVESQKTTGVFSPSR